MAVEAVTVVNKSGKIVSNSKQLVSVWKEAKAAYKGRKAELVAKREADVEHARSQRRALKAAEAGRASQGSPGHSKATSQPNARGHSKRPAVKRGYTESCIASDAGKTRDARPKTLSKIDEEELPVRSRELLTRRTDPNDIAFAPLARRHSEPELPHSARSSIDSALAFGDFAPHGTHLAGENVKEVDEEVELRGKMSKLNMLLNEANCIQHSATAMIEHLQKNPEALAAVALTLAEISAMASKMAPGALTAMKAASPAAMALLASPQFLVAVGLGVGVTVVALGGYKVIKRIKLKKAAKESENTAVEMEELDDVDLCRIETWRRGIADVGAESVGTSVDGEFITPNASRLLAEQGVLHESKSSKGKSSNRKKGSSNKGGSAMVADSSSSKRKHKDGRKKKKQDPSGLRQLFSGANIQLLRKD